MEKRESKEINDKLDFLYNVFASMTPYHDYGVVVQRALQDKNNPWRKKK